MKAYDNYFVKPVYRIIARSEDGRSNLLSACMHKCNCRLRFNAALLSTRRSGFRRKQEQLGLIPK